MCVSIMFTKEAIQSLRSGVLNKKCNKDNSVIGTLHKYHHACFLIFAKMLISNPNVHHAVHLDAIRKRCQKDPLGVVKEYKVIDTTVL